MTRLRDALLFLLAMPIVMIFGRGGVGGSGRSYEPPPPPPDRG